MRRLIHLAFTLTMPYHYTSSICCRSIKLMMTPLVLFLFASRGYPQLAASRDLNNRQGSFSELFFMILLVVVPALILTAVGLVIYAWIRRNKTNLFRLFRRNNFIGKRGMSRYPPTTSSLPTPGARPPTVSGNQSEERETAQVIPSNLDAYTLEAISLNQLEQVLPLREERRIREYYESIAMIIKQYVGEKYQIKIVDAPTGQILESLPHDLTDSVADHVGEILRTCDMIHFSRHRPSRSELTRIYQTAKEFLESQIVVSPAETDSPEDEETDERDRMHEYYRRM